MKKIFKSITMLSLIVLLTGCMKMRIGVEIIDENNAKMTMVVLYDKEMLTSYGQTQADIKKQFSDETFKDSEMKDISEKIDGKEYVGFEIIANKEQTKSLLSDLSVETDGKTDTYTFEASSADMSSLMGENGMDSNSLKGAGYSIKQMKSMGLEMTMSIKMPGKITESTVGKIEDNVVVIDLLQLMEKQSKSEDAEFKIVSTTGESNSSIFLYCAIGVAVVAIVAVAIILIKRKRQENDPNQLEQTYRYEAPNPTKNNEINNEDATVNQNQSDTQNQSDDDSNSSNL